MVRLSLMFLLSLVAAPRAVVLSSTPVPGAPVLVVFAPGSDGAARIAAAGGRDIGPERAPMGYLAVSENVDFQQRLEDEGAWVVADGAMLARICGVSE